MASMRAPASMPQPLSVRRCRRRAVIALAKRCLVLSDADVRRVLAGQTVAAPRRCAATVRDLKQFLCNGAEWSGCLRILSACHRAESSFCVVPSPSPLDTSPSPQSKVCEQADSPCATSSLYSFDAVAFAAWMISPLSLANGLTLLFALLCLWMSASQSRGGMTTLGRLALPGGFAIIAALMLLASVFETSVFHDVLWLAAFVVGSFFGRRRGWALPVRADKATGLVWLPRTIDGVLVSLLLVAAMSVDFTSALVGDVIVEPAYIAAVSALCGGFLGYRVLVIALRSIRPGGGPSELSRAS